MVWILSRGVIEQKESGKLRVDFLIAPPLLKKAKEALGDALIIKEYPGSFPQIRMVIDVDRSTFERFWWNHLTEIHLLGPELEISWLKSMLNAARESMEDTDGLKELLGIKDVVVDANIGKTDIQRKPAKRRKAAAAKDIKIRNERISSNEHESEVHVFGMGYSTIINYVILGEIEIEDEGHTVFIHGQYRNDGSLTGKLYLWATTESLYSIEEEHKEIFGELAKKCNQLSDAGIEKYFPGEAPAERYSYLEAHMLKLFRERTKQDDRWDDITEECIEWEPLYYNEGRKEPFDIDKLYDNIDLELLK